MFRKATLSDLDAVARIYEDIHTEIEAGRYPVRWVRGVYPTFSTAAEAVNNGDLYVYEEDGVILAAARINREPVPAYADARWLWPEPDGGAMILHTLVVSPKSAGRGLGKKFVRFYEDTARENGVACLRLDTGETNTVARQLYKSLGYREADIVSCTFNGIPGIRLVCIEKRL
ncbi:MAG: GNAT family N-acetyltransferase [Oscillospiraceae bacterium]|nr:GNAT family N-acetyltransferase [Oscillospiraceae bacterium]